MRPINSFLDWAGQLRSPAELHRTGQERSFFYCPQDIADLERVEPFYFYCTCLARGCQRCCIVGVGVTSLQMWLSFGKVHLGLGVKHSSFTPHAAAQDKRLFNPALDTEGFRPADLGQPAHVGEVVLPSVLLFFSWWCLSP